jgi:hypothetical protein
MARNSLTAASSTLALVGFAAPREYTKPGAGDK